MFFVDLPDQEDGVEDEDEIDKSIKEIHQSAQILSIGNIASSTEQKVPESEPLKIPSIIATVVKGELKVGGKLDGSRHCQAKTSVDLI